jgi:hypothetical protein
MRSSSSRLLCAAAVGTIVVALAGCGRAGSSASATPGTQTQTQAQAQAAGAAKQSAAVATSRRAPARAHAGRARNAIHRSGVVAVAHGHNSEPSSVVHAVNPCTLVTTQEVAAIIGQPVKEAIVGPLGPTCIYVPGPVARSRSRKGTPRAASIELTLAVDAVNLKSATAQLRNVTAATIRGHRVYCGVIGHPVTYVSLAHGRVMTVTGPCPLAALVAEKALPRLKVA